MQESEKLLEFLRLLKNDTFLCGDFNIDTIKESGDKSDYLKLLLAFDFKGQSFESTGVTPTSGTCLDHIVTSYQIKTETIKTTSSYHYRVSGAIPGVVVKASNNRETKQLSRDLRKIKCGKALIFFISLRPNTQKPRTIITKRPLKDSRDYYALCRQIRTSKRINSEKKVE